MKSKNVCLCVAALFLAACGDDSAVSCFNPRLYQAGNELSEVTYPKGKPVPAVPTRTTVMRGQTTFEGKKVFQIDSFPNAQRRYSSEGSEIIQMDEKTHRKSHLQAKYKDHKDEEVVLLFKPAKYLDFSMTPGEKQTYKYGIQRMNSPTDTSIRQNEVTYLGKETITVAAGTFDACHFASIEKGRSPRIAYIRNDDWVAVGTGLPVKHINELKMKKEDDPFLFPTMVTELFSANVNGQTFEAID